MPHHEFTQRAAGSQGRARPSFVRLALAAGLVAALATGPAASQPASSTSFVLSQGTINAGGGNAVSSSFVLDASISQPATVGDATSTSFVLQSGFWSGLSTRSVITVASASAGTGRGTVTGPDIACALGAGVTIGDCSASFVDGTMFGLVAAPDAANQFDGWSNCDSTTTTSIAGDTCRVTLDDSRTVTASFTLLGTVGDFVWRDVDGDGTQDAGEPGLDGVEVTIDDGDGLSASVITADGGLYGFVDVPPGTYTLSVDPSTLPAGTVPSFDLDGTATPHTTEITLTSGEDLVTADFGYQPQVDLRIEKTDSEDPLPGGDDLVYTIEVENLGPGVATGVTVTDSLPVGTTLVSTSGCAEDPAGAPTCSLGDLAIGASTSFTITVSIDPAPPSSITNTATVAAVEVDIDPSNNSAGQSTDLDDGAPGVAGVGTSPSTADGVLASCESVHGFGVDALVVEFDEAMLDPAGDSTAGDVTNPASWSLVRAGANATLDTAACGAPTGDDVAVPIVVSYDDTTRTATLAPANGANLASGLHRLFACGTGPSVATDRAGNPLDGDGDGTAGGDFSRTFRVDSENLLANAHFDCGLDSWTRESDAATEIVHSAADVDGSSDSGSAGFENPSSDRLALAQCVALGDTLELEMGARVRMSTPAAGIGVQIGCTFYSGTACTGTPSASASGSTLLADTGGVWVRLSQPMRAPDGSRSARCEVEMVDILDGGFAAHLDQAWLRVGGPLFADDFERGDTSAWSDTIQ